MADTLFMVHPCSAQEVAHYTRKNGHPSYFGQVIFCLGAINGITYAPRMIGVVCVGMARVIRSPYVVQLLAIEHDATPQVLPFLYNAAVHAAIALGYHYLATEIDRDAELLEQLGFERRKGLYFKSLVNRPVALPEEKRIEEKPALPPAAGDVLDI